MNTLLTFFLISAAFSTLVYYYLHHKTRISLKYLYLDNVAVIILSALLTYGLSTLLPTGTIWLVVLLLLNLGFVVGIAFAITMIRFWRTPQRKCKAKDTDLVSPADGNVIYIEKIEAGQVPISVKGNTLSRLDELTKTDILQTPCWLIGINMTPFDVHKNCAPMPGKVILNQHFDGRFLSLKMGEALKENERNTLVLDNNGIKIGMVQIASKLVRRIDSYVKEGQYLNRGDWFGMIRFGSQVDVILPLTYNLKINVKDQIYAGETVIAEACE